MKLPAARIGGGLCAATLLTLLAPGCAVSPVLTNVSIAPAAITPDGDGDADVARITYELAAPALITIALTGEDGDVHVFREARPRSPGSYDALFGGVVDERMLQDGTYRVAVVAEPRAAAAFASETVELALEVTGGDTVPPELAGFSVQPEVFSPNQDGLGDRVAISYRLDEPADVRLWLETADGRYVTDILEEKQSGDFPGEPGPHVYDFDAGVDADAPPPPDGEYMIVGRACDAAGNVSTQRLPLTIRNGGQPRVALLGDVEWSSEVVPLGETLTFTATVANVGDTPVRTRGPVPGYTYDNTATFNTPAPLELILLAKHGDRARSRHVPVSNGDVMDLSLELGGEPSGAAKAADGEEGAAPTAEVLASGTITVCGTVLLDGSAMRAADVYLFEPDGDNGLAASTDSYGRFCFQDVRLPPERERTYAPSPGAIRLGLEYDEIRTDLTYPYRWQLGDTEELSVCSEGGRIFLCLAPGQTVTVSGGVRFVEPPFRRNTVVWVALMHEDVRRIQGPYGQQPITVEF